MLNVKTDAYSPKQMEEVTGFTIATLATWRSRGRGPKHFRIAGRVYYLKADVQEWINDQMNSAA